VSLPGAARATGRYSVALRALARTELLILDDWGTESLTDEKRRDLFGVMEDRYDRRATLIAAQFWSNTGTRPSAIQPSQTPCLTDSSTTPTPSPSKENPCENTEART